MTIQELIKQLSQYNLFIVIYFTVIPLLGWCFGFITYNRNGKLTLVDFSYSLLIYLVAFPGVISCILIAYSIFLIKQNLLKVDFFIYFLPVISMILTFIFIGRRVSFDRLPGFGHLYGLMILIGLSFLLVLFLFKLRIVIGFFGSMEHLFIMGIIIFLIFKYATTKLFK